MAWEPPRGPPLACISGGPSDRAVVVEATRIAGVLGFDMIVLLNVVDTGLLPAPPDSLEGKAALEGLRSHSLDALEAASSLARSMGFEVLPVAREGNVCREIVSLAEAAQPPVVVIGYSDRGDELGSTAACVLARYRGTILVAKGGRGLLNPRGGGPPRA